MTEEKKARNFVSEARLKENKRSRNPDDVNSTIRMPAQLRATIATLCVKKGISMNKLIIDLLEIEAKKETN
jgi:predicted HicB family RNase H-like nuclease